MCPRQRARAAGTAQASAGPREALLGAKEPQMSLGVIGPGSADAEKHVNVLTRAVSTVTSDVRNAQCGRTDRQTLAWGSERHPDTGTVLPAPASRQSEAWLG